MLEERVFPPNRFQSGSTISLLQKRNLSDKPEVGWFKFRTRPGTHYFLLQAKLGSKTKPGTSETRRILQGLVVSVPEPHAAHLIDAHNAFRNGSLTIETPLGRPHLDFLAHLDTALGAGHFSLRFELEDDGVLFFESVANAAPSDHIGEQLAFEAYSFIKDVFHKHRFHQPADDALLELTQSSGVQDPNWSKHVIRNLHRSIIASYRTSSKLAQANSLGKLAYLESFVEVARRRGLKIEPEINVATLREALLHHQACAQEEKDDRNLSQSYLVSLVAIFLPLLLVCLQLLQVPCISGLTAVAGPLAPSDTCQQKFHVSPYVISVTAWVLKNLFGVMLTGVALFGMALYFLNRKWFDRYTEVRLTAPSWSGDLRDLYLRLTVSHGRTATNAFAAAAVVAFLLILWFVRWLLVRA